MWTNMLSHIQMHGIFKMGKPWFKIEKEKLLFGLAFQTS
jgi:hypothetical protein